MKFNELSTQHKQSPKRVGRGIAAGQGKTAGRGTKGYGARTGSKAKPGFVGGQNPIMQALPKLPGFRSHRVKMEYVYTGQLAAIPTKEIDGHALAAAGLISGPFVRVKLLTKGDVTKAVTVRVQGASAAATEAVQKAGGSVVVVPQIGRTTREEAEHKTSGSLRKTKKAAKAEAAKS
jgi:large subunit ribosomal protein L15